jgi:hypothetical protein
MMWRAILIGNGVMHEAVIDFAASDLADAKEQALTYAQRIDIMSPVSLHSLYELGATDRS